MDRSTEIARVAIVVIDQFPSEMNTEITEILTDFCESEDMLPIVLLREETSKGVLGVKGYQAIADLLEKDIIDGVVTFNDDVLEGEFGDKLVMDSNVKDFFVISFEQEMAIREAEARKEAENAACRMHNHGIDILTLMMM
ncbi:MAG: hypothetical protein GX567_17350 [Clostridia bacterium]|nr:hypothetical protein [Clostridia bacterium]